MRRILVVLCFVLCLTGCGAENQQASTIVDDNVQEQKQADENEKGGLDVREKEFSISAKEFIDSYNIYAKNSLQKENFFEIQPKIEGEGNDKSYVVSFDSGIGLLNDNEDGKLQLITMNMLSTASSESFVDDCIQMMGYVDKDFEDINSASYDFFNDIISNNKNGCTYLMYGNKVQYFFSERNITDGLSWMFSIAPNEDTEKGDGWITVPDNGKEYEFTAGEYIVGKDIPACNYNVAWVSGMGNCFAGVLLETFGEDEKYCIKEYKNISLTDGSKIVVDGTLKIKFIAKRN